MNEIFSQLLLGFEVALTPINIMWTTLGGVLGTIIGMLPGLGPATGVAVLLPLTFKMGPVGAMITMAGVYYGAMFGGSRASILLNTPGDGAAIATCFDGYPMTQKGRAEAALAMSAVASFIGGMIANVAMVFVAVPVAKFSLRFGPAEYTLLMLFALAATAAMSKEKILQGFIGMTFGLMISTVGLDGLTGVNRFTFGVLELMGGVDFLIIIIGIYALGEVFKSFKSVHDPSFKMQTKFGKIKFTKEDWKRSWPAILRSTPLGFFIGALPGAGGTMAALMAYNNEKNISKHPEEFGQGAVEGLAAPEAANNASSVGALIPMMTLGIPGSGTTAVMLGALLMLGLQPGPLLFQKQPEVAWGMIASMFIGNIILLIVNMPMASILVRVLAVPAKVLYPLILGLAFIGTYAITNSIVDFFILIGFGLIGIFLEKAKIPTSPLILGGIVGATMETSFRQALMLSDGSPKIFYGSPITVTLIALTVFSIAWPFVSSGLKRLKASRSV
ncbi:MAG TPA: transporter [Spirochaetaceae bacterium]|jgi:putative tricarboxylic transport membrane protein|nr:transporter [Spirochaetaceae bacterium]